MDTAADTTFEINGQFIISETIDNETVIINLNNGSYYSLKNAGPTIWAVLGQPATPAVMVAALQSEFDIDTEQARQAVDALLGRLLEEDLIRQAEPGTAASEPSALTPSAAPRPFVPPTLDKFTDLEAMLLLDPVHDVDETGWPQLPASLPFRPTDAQ